MLLNMHNKCKKAWKRFKIQIKTLSTLFDPFPFGLSTFIRLSEFTLRIYLSTCFPKCDMFLESPWAGQTGNVGKVGNEGKSGKLRKVGKVGQVGKVGKVGTVEKVWKLGKVGNVGRVQKVGKVQKVRKGQNSSKYLKISPNSSKMLQIGFDHSK